MALRNQQPPPISEIKTLSEILNTICALRGAGHREGFHSATLHLTVNQAAPLTEPRYVEEIVLAGRISPDLNTPCSTYSIKLVPTRSFRFDDLPATIKVVINRRNFAEEWTESGGPMFTKRLELYRESGTWYAYSAARGQSLDVPSDFVNAMHLIAPMCRTKDAWLRPEYAPRPESSNARLEPPVGNDALARAARRVIRDAQRDEQQAGITPPPITMEDLLNTPPEVEEAVRHVMSRESRTSRGRDFAGRTRETRFSVNRMLTEAIHGHYPQKPAIRVRDFPGHRDCLVQFRAEDVEVGQSIGRQEWDTETGLMCYGILGELDGGRETTVAEVRQPPPPAPQFGPIYPHSIVRMGDGALLEVPSDTRPGMEEADRPTRAQMVLDLKNRIVTNTTGLRFHSTLNAMLQGREWSIADYEAMLFNGRNGVACLWGWIRAARPMGVIDRQINGYRLNAEAVANGGADWEAQMRADGMGINPVVQGAEEMSAQLNRVRDSMLQIGREAAAAFGDDSIVDTVRNSLGALGVGMSSGVTNAAQNVAREAAPQQEEYMRNMARRLTPPRVTGVDYGMDPGEWEIELASGEVGAMEDDGNGGFKMVDSPVEEVRPPKGSRRIRLRE